MSCEAVVRAWRVRAEELQQLADRLRRDGLWTEAADAQHAASDYQLEADLLELRSDELGRS